MVRGHENAGLVGITTKTKNRNKGPGIEISPIISHHHHHPPLTVAHSSKTDSINFAVTGLLAIKAQTDSLLGLGASTAGQVHISRSGSTCGPDCLSS